MQLNTFKITLLNPSGNPSDIETEYVSADSEDEARQEAERLLDVHPFNDVSLLSVERIDPKDLYHEDTTA